MSIMMHPVWKMISIEIRDGKLIYCKCAWASPSIILKSVFARFHWYVNICNPCVAEADVFLRRKGVEYIYEFLWNLRGKCNSYWIKRRVLNNVIISHSHMIYIYIYTFLLSQRLIESSSVTVKCNLSDTVRYSGLRTTSLHIDGKLSYCSST